MNNWQHECICKCHEDVIHCLHGSCLAERVIHVTELTVRHEHQAIAQLHSFRHSRKRMRLVQGMLGLAVTAVITMFLLSPALAQEQTHAYGEYTFWSGGAFGNGHAFSNTMDARNYQFENRYERLIYWNEPFAVRWVFDLVPLAVVGDPRTGKGHRPYSYGIGGSPMGAQVNFVHFRRVEPFLTSGGGFLRFNHQMFGQTRFNFTAQLGGGVQLFTSSRRAALDLGYKYHHISNANLGNQNPGLDSHMVFVGISLFR